MQIRVIRVPVSFVGRQGDPALYVVEGADFRAYSDRAPVEVAAIVA